VAAQLKVESWIAHYKAPNKAMNTEKGLDDFGLLKGLQEAAGRRLFSLLSFLAVGLSR
jgi:hypothetical protein